MCLCLFRLLSNDSSLFVCLRNQIHSSLYPLLGIAVPFEPLLRPNRQGLEQHLSFCLCGFVSEIDRKKLETKRRKSTLVAQNVVDCAM